MADNSAERALRYLSDPTVLAGLGAVAVGSLFYMATRPQPTNCPVNPQRQSVEIPGDNYARRSAISEELTAYMFEDCRTTHEIFLRGTRISGDKPCLGRRTSEDGPYEWLTYNETLARSCNVGAGLQELGSASGEGDTFIGVYASNKIEWVLVEQACAMHAMVITPLYDTLGPDACTFIINQAKMSTVVCDAAKVPLILDRSHQCPTLKYIIQISPGIKEEEKTKAEEKGIRILTFSEVEELGRKHPHEKKLPSPDDLAVVCYTSGTTGNPKGVMISHGNAVAMLTGLCVMIEKCGINVDNNDVHISYLPLAHMYERLAQLMIFMYGGKVGFFGGNIRKIMQDLQELKPTVFISVPRVLNRVYDRVIKETSSNPITKFIFNTALNFKKAEVERNIIRKDSIWDYLVFRKIQNTLGGRVRFLISGSAPLRNDVMMFLRSALGCYVLEGYGQTETTAAASIQLVGDNSFGHVGPPMPCTKIKLVDVPDMNYFAKDGKGEICFYGPNVFKGYLNDPEKTREAIDDDGWLHSGDVGEWNENGTLKLIDRKKHIFKLAQGEYIAPEKIEAVYLQCPLVHQIYVYGNSMKSCIVSVVVPEEGPLKKWAAKNDVNGDMDALCKNQKVHKAILDEMTAMGKKEKLFSFQQVKGIYLHPDPFTVDNGLLTPTLKFKRPAIRAHFSDTFDKLYDTLPE